MIYKKFHFRPSQSPSLSGRLTSPAPRMTSPQHPPQHRIATGATGQMMLGGRMTSPVNPYGQQGIAQSQMMTNQQQNRFIRPQMMMQSANPRQTMMTLQQQTQQMHLQQQQQQQQVQVQQQQQVNRQNSLGYNSPQVNMDHNSPLGSPQPTGNSQQLSMDHIQNQRTMQLVQQRQMIQVKA